MANVQRNCLLYVLEILGSGRACSECLRSVFSISAFASRSGVKRKGSDIGIVAPTWGSSAIIFDYRLASALWGFLPLINSNITQSTFPDSTAVGGNGLSK
jgi:hypothetical protein